MQAIQNHGLQRDSTGWQFFAKASWGASVLAMGLGIIYLPVELWVKGYVAMGMLYLMGATFTLAKTVRDQHEADRLINQIKDAKTQKIIEEYAS